MHRFRLNPFALGLLVLPPLVTGCGGSDGQLRDDLSPRVKDCSADGGGNGCPEGQVCSPLGTCVERCASDEECAVTERCDMASGLCVRSGVVPMVDAGRSEPCGTRPADPRLRRCNADHDPPVWVECISDDDCTGGGETRACHPELFRCVRPAAEPGGLCDPCTPPAEGEPSPCAPGFECRVDAPPGHPEPGPDAQAYCQPVVDMPSLTSCPAAGFAYRTTPMPRCVAPYACASIRAATDELSCSAPEDCARLDAGSSEVAGLQCRTVEGSTETVCRLACKQYTDPMTMEMRSYCPPGFACGPMDVCMPDTSGGAGGSGTDMPPSDV